ncbi:hypothetical protein L596_024478 [Steinernema carpocapsae]|uniref:Dynein associated protein domain-containing protein n=1 Tax=Steinernema carpocapsae TaxID=34508 RepID=A0A4U5MHV6_STECR|nr:hypothetical protein L596_024478 [Steinernema carpocapsae]
MSFDSFIDSQPLEPVDEMAAGSVRALPKLREVENLRIKYESLHETKMELAAQVNRLTSELDLAKKTAAEATKAKQDLQEEYADFGERLEEATIDKEIAEERCEQLQIEINGLKVEVEELEMDYGILKSEMEGADLNSGAANSVVVKLLEEKNRKLQEGLFKLRDIVNDHTIKKNEAEQELIRLKNLNAELNTIAEKASKCVGEKDSIIARLQKQVDAFLGSKKMIENLTEKNLGLEDTIARLEGEVEELESLNVVNEELLEAAKAHELTLKAEVDAQIGRNNELRATIFSRDTKIKEVEKFIEKYRQSIRDYDEQIMNLKDEILVLNDRLEAQAAGQEFGREEASLLTAASNFSDIVSHRICDIECNHAQNHVKYLKTFLPDNFSKPGGDNDALLIYVMLPRIADKLALLIELTSQQYPMVPGGMRRDHVTKAHRAEQWVFAAHLTFEARGLIAMLKKCESALKLCSVDRLARVAPMQMEISTQERSVDTFLDQLKTGRLDENTNLDLLGKATVFFENLFTLNLSSDSHDTNLFMSQHLDQMSAGVTWLKRNLERILLFLAPSEDATDIKVFVTLLSEEVDAMEQLVLKGKTRIPDKSSDRALNLTTEFLRDIEDANIALLKFARMVHTLCSSAAGQIHVLTAFLT